MYRTILSIALIFAICSATFAGGWSYELFVSLSAEKASFEGLSPGGQFGASIASGDFNNDGFDDLLVGSPFASNGDKKWGGSATVIFGGIDEVNFDTSNSVTFWGMSSGDQLGSSVESGDFNNDGFDDIVIGAFNAYYKGNRNGRVYVIYGQPDLANRWGSQSVDFSYYKADLLLSGAFENGGFGLSLESGDVDGDNIDDLLVGAPMASSSVSNNSGAVNLYLGDYDGLSQFSDATFYGQTKGERFGASIAVGDIGGDAGRDVAIGAYLADNGLLTDSGRVYLYIDVPNSSVRVTNPTSYIEGINKNGWFGFDVEIGNVGQRGIDDLVVSSFPYNGDRDYAGASVFYGRSDFAKEGSVFFAKDDLIDFEIKKDYGETVIGAAVELADLDGDSIQEILLGAPGIGNPSSSYPGNVYVVYSGYAGGPIAHIYGENADDWFGYSVSSGDFNGDDRIDLIVGSRYSDGNASVNNGKVFVIYGDGGIFGDPRSYRDEDTVGRAELVSKVVDRFNLKTAKSNMLNKCDEHKEFCLFDFIAMSDFDGLTLEPDLLLYPDIALDYEHYENITVATMLGIVNGYLAEPGSPFFPDKKVSRIQALKIILGAADLVEAKYHFELVNILGSLKNLINQTSYFPDVNAKIAHMWWYPRYVNFAAENGIIEKGGLFRPDDSITMGELDELIENTLKYLRTIDAQAESPGGPAVEAFSLRGQEKGA